jgi:hypothetical protein
MKGLWGVEPTAIITGLVAFLGLLVAFGVPLTGIQSDAIVALANALLVIVGGYVIRGQVISTAKVDATFGPGASDDAGAMTREDMA